MQKDLIALMPSAAPFDLPPKLTMREVSGWRAILAPKNHQKMRLKARRSDLLKRAQTRQSWLEDLMAQGTVLPALPGARIRGNEVSALVAANAAELDRLLTRLDGQHQYQITIRCDTNAAHKQARVPIAQNAPPTPEIWAHTFATYAEEQLQKIPLAQIQHLPLEGDLVLNVAILIPSQAEPSLALALEAIDAIWSDGLAIRQIGPSPAVSFASIGLTAISARTLSAARRLLGVDVDASPSCLQAARQSLLKRNQLPPDDIRRAAEILTRAQAMQTPGPFPFVFVWSEGQSLPSALKSERVAA